LGHWRGQLRPREPWQYEGAAGLMGHVLTGTVLIFGGPYSNLHATRALRAKADQLGIPADHCICTGDVVAYCADAAATVAEIRAWGCSVVMGNCEESLGLDQLDCGCGFEEGTACGLLSKQWFDHARAQLDASARQWMAACPRSLNFTLGAMSAQVIHGSPTSINEFVFASQTDVIEGYLKDADTDVIIGGHCGVPFYHRAAAKLWLNAGVIGMPANDATAQTWYMLLTPHEDGAVQISVHRLSYDYEGAADAMAQAHLAQGYQAGLSSGLWPSLDVLPAGERGQTGQALSEWCVMYAPASIQCVSK